MAAPLNSFPWLSRASTIWPQFSFLILTCYSSPRCTCLLVKQLSHCLRPLPQQQHIQARFAHALLLPRNSFLHPFQPKPTHPTKILPVLVDSAQLIFLCMAVLYNYGPPLPGQWKELGLWNMTGLSFNLCGGWTHLISLSHSSAMRDMHGEQLV